jgi:hypothetical protein
MDAIVPVIAAVLGSLVGGLFTYWIAARQSKQELAAQKQELGVKNRDAAAAYLEAIAAALEGMASSFDSGTIPYVQGHTFQRLVDTYEPVLGPHLGNAVGADLRRLQAIARRAEEQDGFIRAGDTTDATSLLADMMRIVGDLRATAVTLRATGVS